MKKIIGIVFKQTKVKYIYRTIISVSSILKKEDHGGIFFESNIKPSISETYVVNQVYDMEILIIIYKIKHQIM